MSCHSSRTDMCCRRGCRHDKVRQGYSDPLGNKLGLITDVDDLATVVGWTALLLGALC
eukprot:COSAG01_NODE_10668_length_2107_cov_3.571926_1_plen_57_part_10